MERYDVIVVGAGLAGLVAATEAAERGFSVCVVDQEGEQNLGGQAFWSLGGLFFVDSPEQRRMRVRDSLDLARQDWFGSAGFDRPEDHWPRRWAEAYLDFAAGEKREWLHRMGMRWFPVVGWAERGGSLADGHGNSVPRFHVTWGTGPGVLAPFVKKAEEMAASGRLTFRFRHQVDRLETTDGRITGISGVVLAADPVLRGQKSSRELKGDFRFSASAIIVSSGGIGGNQELVRRNWPVERLGRPPENMVCGVPAHVDGRMIGITEMAGGTVINRDRMWFILTKAIIKKEFALSGSEQNPDLTGKDVRLLLKRLGKEPPGPVRAFMERGEDFVVRDTLEELVAEMNAIGGDRLNIDHIRRQIEARDREIENGFSKDAQVTAIHGARRYLGDRLMRTAKPHRLLDPAMGPLIAVRLHVLTRKTLGGLHTDLEARVLDATGQPVPGLHAAGEVAGFGGGGMHGYNALEGTFLGGCLFSGRVAGRKVLG